MWMVTLSTSVELRGSNTGKDNATLYGWLDLYAFSVHL